MEKINVNFDEKTNELVSCLLRRTAKGSPPRLKKRGKDNKLAKFTSFILEAQSKHSTLESIVLGLEITFNHKTSISSISRFLKERKNR